MLAPWLWRRVYSPRVNVQHAPVLCQMISDFSQHFLQVLPLIFRPFKMYFIQLLVLITWSWMTTINPVISGNNLSAFSHAFDDALINVWLSRSYTCLLWISSSSSLSSKFVGLYCIPAFSIKGCLDIQIPVLETIFNLILLQHTFPTLWKQAAVVPISKKGKTALINYYRPIIIFSTFSKIFEIIIHEHISQHFKSKIDSSKLIYNHKSCCLSWLHYFPGSCPASG
jgi:hypothetical protein